MSEIRLGWEPENRTPLSEIERRFCEYMRGKTSGVSLLENGTLVFTEEGRADEDDARRAMHEARFLIDFQVTPLKEGGFLVTFHQAVAVFVGQQEFETQRDSIVANLPELRFPGEQIVGKENSQSEHMLVGLYARGKLQRDAHNFKFYKRIRGSS